MDTDSPITAAQVRELREKTARVRLEIARGDVETAIALLRTQQADAGHELQRLLAELTDE